MPPNAPRPKNIEPHKWQKGQSGNPKGRPKLPNLKQAIADVLAEKKDGLQALDVVLKALRAKAMKGDVRAIEVLLDRAYGKALQRVEADVNTTVIQAVQAPNPEGDLPGTTTDEEDDE